MATCDKENLKHLTRVLKSKFTIRQWRRWCKLTGELCKEIAPGIPVISKMNKLLAEVFDMAGLGGDFTFENILHTYVCLKLREKSVQNNPSVKLLREMFDKPYAILDHFKRARFQYDAREFVDVQGIIHPSKKELLDDKKHRVVVTGNYTLLVPCEFKKRKEDDVILLFVHQITSRLVVPKEVAGYKITRLGDYLFYSQRTLHELFIPKTIPFKNFGRMMCAHCADLMSVRYGDIRKSSDLFDDLKKIKNEAEKTFVKGCFKDCRNLEKEHRFSCNNSNTQSLDFVVHEDDYFRDRQPWINAASFSISFGAYWLKIKRVDVSGEDKKKGKEWFIALKPSCQRILHEGFHLPEEENYDNDKIKLKVTSKKCFHLSEMGTYAFRNNTDVTEIDLSGTAIARIEFATFSRCTSLKKINFPKTLQYISPTAFHRCEKLCEISFGNEKSNKNFILDNTTGMLFTSGMRTLIFVLKSESKSEDKPKDLALKIQKKLKNAPVVHIGAFAFSVQKLEIDKFEVPEGVTFIGENAFRENSKINQLTLPKTLMAVGPCAFSGNPSLKFDIAENHCFFKTGKTGEKTLLYSKDGTKLIAGSAYLGKKLSLKGVKEICGGAFLRVVEKSSTFSEKREEALELTDVAKLEYIAEYAFENCSVNFNLKDAKKLRAIGKCAFSKCEFENSNLELPESLVWIGREAFRMCQGVEEITISESVKFIGDRVFEGCKDLKIVKIPKTVLEKLKAVWGNDLKERLFGKDKDMFFG